MKKKPSVTQGNQVQAVVELFGNFKVLKIALFNENFQSSLKKFNLSLIPQVPASQIPPDFILCQCTPFKLMVGRDE